LPICTSKTVQRSLRMLHFCSHASQLHTETTDSSRRDSSNEKRVRLPRRHDLVDSCQRRSGMMPPFQRQLRIWGSTPARVAIRGRGLRRNTMGILFKESDETTKAPHSQNQVPLRHLLQCNRDARSRKQSLQDPQHHDSMDYSISPRQMDNIHMQDEHICCLPFCTSAYRSGTSMAKESTEYYAAFAGRNNVQLVTECHHSGSMMAVEFAVGLLISVTPRAQMRGINGDAKPESDRASLRAIRDRFRQDPQESRTRSRT